MRTVKCATTTSVWFQNIFSSQKRNLTPNKQLIPISLLFIPWKNESPFCCYGLTYYRFSYNGIIQYLTFCVLIFLLSVML